MKILFALALTFIITSIQAQKVERIAELITDGYEQKWKLVKSNGNIYDECEQNLVYEFFLKDQIVYQTLCKKKEIFNWRIFSDGYKNYITFTSNDPSQKLWKTVYEIQIIQKNEKVLMRLRRGELNFERETEDYYFEKLGD